MPPPRPAPSFGPADPTSSRRAAGGPTRGAAGAPLAFPPRRMPYRLLRPLLFSLPAETAHGLAAAALDAALAARPARDAARAALAVDHPALRVTRWGIDFPNPVGLAAGFDKSGEHFNALGALGFGFVEIGTVTAHAQPGNPHPRLFRLPADGALLNRLGFNNPGAEAVARRLGRTPIEPVLGINLGKSKVTPLEEAAGDYLRSLELLEPFAALPGGERLLPQHPRSAHAPGRRPASRAPPRPARARRGAGRRARRPSPPRPPQDRPGPHRRAGGGGGVDREGGGDRRGDRHQHHRLARGAADAARPGGGAGRGGDQRPPPARPRDGGGLSRVARDAGEPPGGGRGRDLRRAATPGSASAPAPRWCSCTPASCTAAPPWCGRSTAGCSASCAGRASAPLEEAVGSAHP